MSRRSPVSAAGARRPRGTVVAMVGLTMLLAGCAGLGEPSTSPSASSTPAQTPVPTPSAAEPEEPTGPVLMPDGSAADNLPLFTAVTAEVWASDARESGRAYIDALTAAGFDRTRMQVTADRTTVGNPAESMQFSVAWGEDECLVGQVGPSTGEPVTAVMSQLQGGRCLIGSTRPIDW